MSGVIDILLGSAFIAFVWEPAIIGIYFMIHAFSKMGKIHVVRFKKVGGLRIAMRASWPSTNSQLVTPVKGETHTIEPESYAYLEKNGLATNPVLFVDTDRMRPLIPSFNDPAPSISPAIAKGTPEYESMIKDIQKLSAKRKPTPDETKTLEDLMQQVKLSESQGILDVTAIPHNPKGIGRSFSLNPRTADANALLKEKTVKQLVMQGALGNASLIFILLAIGVGVGIGYAMNGLLNPQHLVYACPPADSCTAPVATTTATGQTLTASP